MRSHEAKVRKIKGRSKVERRGERITKRHDECAPPRTKTPLTITEGEVEAGKWCAELEGRRGAASKGARSEKEGWQSKAPRHTAKNDDTTGQRTERDCGAAMQCMGKGRKQIEWAMMAKVQARKKGPLGGERHHARAEKDQGLEPQAGNRAIQGAGEREDKGMPQERKVG